MNGFGQYIPLTATYELYRALGEPHTVRRFLRAVRRSPHFVGRPAPNLVEPLDGTAPVGRNLYIFGDELTFAVGKVYFAAHFNKNYLKFAKYFI